MCSAEESTQKREPYSCLGEQEKMWHLNAPESWRIKRRRSREKNRGTPRRKEYWGMLRRGGCSSWCSLKGDVCGRQGRAEAWSHTLRVWYAPLNSLYAPLSLGRRGRGVSLFLWPQERIWSPLNYFFKNHLFIWLRWVLVAVHRIFDLCCNIQDLFFFPQLFWG